jgi:hypothetical protein
VTPRIAEHDPERFLKQLRTQRITLILTKSPENDEFGNDLARAARMLMRRGCAERIRRFSATAIESRTLRTLGGENPEKRAVSLYRVKTEECRL